MGTAIFNHGDNVTPRDFELISDAGFDFLITCGGKAHETALEECLKYGIAVIAGNDTLPWGGNILEAAKNGTLDWASRFFMFDCIS